MNELSTNLANEDKMAIAIENEHDIQNDLLRNQYKKIKDNIIENPNLKEVLDGLTAHYESNRNEKEQQCEALEKIMDYIDDVNNNEELTPTLLNECKNDKHRLINEMQKIRNDINTILDK
tara:strand:+ start:155 stop:514 length:360 start_codon:yes stop_codon:yes gene_type:complete